MYTIFINETIVYLTEKPLKKHRVEVNNYHGLDLQKMIANIEDGGIRSLCIHHHDLDVLWNDFKAEFSSIEAAGGIVFNEKNETLWIFRHQKWDLPKGKIEEHENLEEAALREVMEECGVTNLKIVGHIGKTYHVYPHKGKKILKTTHWYKMHADSHQDLCPQTEEHITKVAWINDTELKNVLKNTYGNIKLLCKFAVLKN